MDVYVVLGFGLLIWIICSAYNRHYLSRLHGSRWLVYKQTYSTASNKQAASERFWFIIFGPVTLAVLFISLLDFDVDWCLPLVLKRHPERFHPYHP